MSIAILGLHPHAGVTRMTILLAEYLANYCGFRVNVVEKSSKKDLACLQLLEGMSVETAFCLHHVNYQIAGYQNSKIPLGTKPDYCIYDMGSSFGREQELLAECDVVIALFQMTPWYYDMEQLKNAVEQFKMKDCRVHYVGNMIAINERRKINRLLRRVEYLEYEPQLFLPTIQAVRVFQQIICR